MLGWGQNMPVLENLTVVGQPRPLQERIVLGGRGIRAKQVVLVLRDWALILLVLATALDVHQYPVKGDGSWTKGLLQ